MTELPDDGPNFGTGELPDDPLADEFDNPVRPRPPSTADDSPDFGTPNFGTGELPDDPLADEFDNPAAGALRSPPNAADDSPDFGTPNFGTGELPDDPLADEFDNPVRPRPPSTADDSPDFGTPNFGTGELPDDPLADEFDNPAAGAVRSPASNDRNDGPGWGGNDDDRASDRYDADLGDPFDKHADGVGDRGIGPRSADRFRQSKIGGAVKAVLGPIAGLVAPVTSPAGKVLSRIRARFVRRYGLRRQIVAAFAIGALLLSLVFSFTSYALFRTNLLERRAELATTRAAVNAETVNRRLTGDLAAQQLSSVVDNLNAPEGTQPLLRVLRGADPDDWLSPNPLGFFEDDVDPGLRVAVDNGNAARMRYIPAELASHQVRDELAGVGQDEDGDEEFFDPDDDIHLVIAIPLTGTRPPAQYFEATSLRDLDETLSSLAFTLFGVSAITTLAGLGLGFFFANRTLRPLGEISLAAQNIARGDLSTRLDSEADRDLRILTNSFNEMASNLEEKVQNDARFASEVSHELRSPLMTLTASVAVLEKRIDELPEKAQVAVELLSTDIERFKQLVEDLLEISRYDVGAAAAETNPVPIDEFIRQAVAFSGMLDVPVHVDPAAEGLYVDLDKRRLAQVVRNLLENAAKYAGGATEISIERDLDAVLVAVEDLGPGVPLKEREVIFERFSRGAEGGRRGSGTGVGLGLALVQEHIALHGGSVWVTDRLDGQSGSRFVIRLPGVIERPRELQ